MGRKSCLSNNELGDELAEGQNSMGSSERDYIWLVSGHWWWLNSRPVLFNVFINMLDAGVESIFSRFTDNTNLGGDLDSPERWDFAEGSRHLRALGNHQRHEIQWTKMLDASRVMEQCQTQAQPGIPVAGEQISRTGSGGAAQQQARHKPATYPGT